MPLTPVVRYVILAMDWEFDPTSDRRINVFGLLNNIDSLDDPPFPVIVPEISCVALTECRRPGRIRLQCIFEETGEMVFAMPFQEAKFGNDPLDVVLLPYRMRRCVFPYPGVYAVQFVFDGEVLGDCPLRVR